jgi:MtN3 and saliva related transmembrane protein
MVETIKFIFGFCLVANALLYIPQAYKLIKTRTSKEISLFTFIGFFLIQLVTVLYGWTQHDYMLIFGYILSMIGSGSIILLALKYKMK